MTTCDPGEHFPAECKGWTLATRSSLMHMKLEFRFYMFASSRDAAVRHATVAGLFQYTLGNFPIGSVWFLLDCNQSALE